MSRLVNQNWIGLSGTPLTGMTPPQLLLLQGQMTPARYAEVAHVYHMFCLSKTTAVGDFFITNRVLKAGTRVRCESRQNIDRVLVWAAGSEDAMAELPHGFGVVTNWQDPRFYYKPDKVAWGAPGKTPPQLQKGDVTYNHVTYELQRGSETHWEFYPLVHGAQAKRVWGWAPYKGLELTHENAMMPDAGFGKSKNTIVPIAPTYQVGGKPVRRSRHFAVDDWILAPDGKKLYAMDEVEPMTSNGSDPLRKLPPCSDATGTRVALQQWRRWLVSQANQVYRFRLCSEVLERTADKVYQQQSRDVEEFSTNLRLPANAFEPGELDETPLEPHLHRFANMGGATWQIGTVAYNAQGQPYVIPDPYWSQHLKWVVFGIVPASVGPQETGAVIRTKAGGQMRASGAPKTIDVYPKLLALPQWTGIQHCQLVNKLAYAPEIFLRAAAKTTRFAADVKDLRDCYGLASHTIYRRNAEHSIDADPQLSLDFGWAQLHMLEGELTGQYTAHAHVDQKIFKNSYVDTYQGVEPPGQWWTSSTLSEPSDDGGATVGFLRLNGMLSGLIDFDSIRAEYPSNNATISKEDLQEPTCTGGYSYKSRYVLDFDNRAQFCSAIRVEASCAGASWSQIPGRYLGALQDDGPAHYTVNIYFEVRVGDRVFSKKLLEESVEKKAFEFRAIHYDNVLIWPQGDTDRELWVYMPPELVPPMEAHMHLEAIAAHQGVNTHFAGNDVPAAGVSIPPKQVSEKQLEHSRNDAVREIPHPRRPTGILYARSFKLSEFLDGALWMFGQKFLKFDAPKNINYLNPDSPMWHYFPVLGAAINSEEKIHIEFRNDQFVDWSDDIKERPKSTKPAKGDKNIEVYYV